MSNIETAFEYFLAHGFTSAQSSGIVGNLIQESGVNPESIQSPGPGRGIAQWSLGGRWQPGLMTGNVPADLNDQLDFIDQELQSNPAYGLSALLASTTPQQAATVFSADYERPGIIGNRVNDATQVYNDAQTGNWPTATSGSITLTSGPGGSSGSSSGGSSGGGSWWDTVASTIIPGWGIVSGVSDVGKIGQEIASVVGFAAQKETQTTQSHTFVGSLDELLNPSISLLNPWGIITMTLARGGLALIGLVLILGGVGVIILGTKEGREAAKTGIEAAAVA